jgi:hypothetical protein
VSGGSLLGGLRLGAWGRRIILRLKKKELLWIQIRVLQLVFDLKGGL